MVAAIVGVVAAGASLVGSSMQAGAASDAADAQAQANAEAIAEQQREYNQTRSDQMPFLQAGYGALKRENAVLNGNYSGFKNSPDYKYALSQMIRGDDRSAAASGNLFASGYGVNLGHDLNGLAEQNLNNYWAKLAGQAGQGFQAGNSISSAGQNSANNISSLLNASGNARASGIVGSANAWGNGISQAAGAFGSYFGNSSAAPYTPVSTTSLGEYQPGGVSAYNPDWTW